MQLHELLSLLRDKNGKEPQKIGGGFTVCCPAHDDSNPSLSIAEGEDGKILLKCFAGCSPEEICSSLGIDMKDLFSQNLDQNRSSKKTIYSYEDEEEKELYRKIRIEPGFNRRDKSFYWERLEDGGTIVRNINLKTAVEKEYPTSLPI